MSQSHEERKTTDNRRAAREARLAEKLRQNLIRRKAKTRAQRRGALTNAEDVRGESTAEVTASSGAQERET